MQLPEIAPHAHERCALIGQTGTGKSYLAAHLLAEHEFSVVHDGKGTTSDADTGKIKPEWAGYKLVRSVAEAAALNPAKHPRIIYRPTAAAMLAGDRKFFAWCYRRRNHTLYVDELSLVCHTTLPSPELVNCITRGREFGLDVWVGTQRPMGIPKICFTEAENVYCFFLKDKDDRQRVEQNTGIDSDDVWELDKQEFLFARQSARDTVGPLTLRVEGDQTPAREGVENVYAPRINMAPQSRRQSLLDRVLFGTPGDKR